MGVLACACSRADAGSACQALRPAAAAQAKACAMATGDHRRRGNGGIEQHAVVAPFHHLRGLRGQAEACVDNQRGARAGVRATRAGRIRVHRLGRCRWCCPRHQCAATGIEQAAAGDWGLPVQYGSTLKRRRTKSARLLPDETHPAARYRRRDKLNLINRFQTLRAPSARW